MGYTEVETSTWNISEKLTDTPYFPAGIDLARGIDLKRAALRLTWRRNRLASMLVAVAWRPAPPPRAWGPSCHQTA